MGSRPGRPGHISKATSQSQRRPQRCHCGAASIVISLSTNSWLSRVTPAHRLTCSSMPPEPSSDPKERYDLIWGLALARVASSNLARNSRFCSRKRFSSASRCIKAFWASICMSFKSTGPYSAHGLLRGSSLKLSGSSDHWVKTSCMRSRRPANLTHDHVDNISASSLTASPTLAIAAYSKRDAKDFRLTRLTVLAPSSLELDGAEDM